MEKVSGNRLMGTVKWFNSKKGYGFVCDEEGSEYFLHITNMHKKNNKLQWPHQGDTIEFDLKQHEKGMQAVNVDIKECARVKRKDKK